MTLVKSLLLGSAAGLVAVTSGQAAELPAKADPVKYMKVCSLYGAGFYYMPGSDLCLKIGGWERGELTWGGNSNITWGPYNANQNNRTTSNIISRTRGYITVDAREQTAYGVARAYIAAGIATSDTGTVVPSLVDNVNRAYVQWAGFTAGVVISFYDFYNVAAAEYRGAYLPASDTGDGGWWVWGYTAQFGGGFSATMAAEERRMTQICDNQAIPAGVGVSSSCTIAPGAYLSAIGLAGANTLFPGLGAYGGQQIPDIVGNLRVDQTWGSAQVMAVAHELTPSYYSLAGAPGSAPSMSAGHPSDAWGWAAGAGLKVNFPSIAEGDYLQSQVNFTQGALRYLFNTPNTNWGKVDGASEAYGVLSDCVYGGAASVAGSLTSCQLTTGWGFNASYEHYWTPQWHESVYGSYTVVRYDMLANAMLCVAEDSGVGNNGGVGGLAALTPGSLCNNNWSTWGIGTRLQYDVTRSFYVGVEAVYQDLHSAIPAAGPGTAIGGNAFGGATLQVADQSNLALTVRMHKDFLP